MSVGRHASGLRVEEFSLPAEAVREGELRSFAGRLAGNGNEGPYNVSKRHVSPGNNRRTGGVPYTMIRHNEDKILGPRDAEKMGHPHAW